MADLRNTTNTWTNKNTFSINAPVSSSSTTGAITILQGGLVASGGIKGGSVYSIVWNDFVDNIPVDEECNLEYGKCYCFDGEHYIQSSKYMQDGIIGIHSDTAGMSIGHKENIKELSCSVAGFVLAYVDKEYKPGTPLTCTENGYLTEISKKDKREYPEKIVATYWKSEPNEEWGDDNEKVKVNHRHWVKVR